MRNVSADAILIFVRVLEMFFLLKTYTTIRMAISDAMVQPMIFRVSIISTESLNINSNLSAHIHSIAASSAAFIVAIAKYFSDFLNKKLRILPCKYNR